MNSINLKKIFPHALALLLFIVISLIYFSPLLSGKILQQSDIIQFKGMAHECSEYLEKTGESAFWTNSMFGGMPTYQILSPKSANLVQYLDTLIKLGIPRPASYLFVCLAGFYFLLVLLRLRPVLAVAGALGFGFSLYNFLILEAGHNTKFLSMAYMAPIVAGVLLAYRKNIGWGAGIFALGLALNIYANHPQITYYTLIMLLIYVIIEFIHALKKKTLPKFAKTSIILAICAVVAIGTNTAHLWTTYEYSKATIRGGSELDGKNKSGGLDKDYALQWSYGILETFTLLVPRFMGGASNEAVSNDYQTFKMIKQSGQTPKNGLLQSPTYWGNQPFTGGPTYHGAIICFLFLLGCFVVKGRYKWWLLITTILVILLSWGRNFDAFTTLFFNFFPMYNKFRTVSMILIVAQFTMPLLGMLALHQIIEGQNNNKKQILQKLYLTTGILSGLLLIFALLGPAIFSFSSPADANYPAEFIKYLITDRATMLRIDSLRSLAFILLAAALVWAIIQQKIKPNIAVAIIAALIFIDLATVSRKYLNNDNFVSEKSFDKIYDVTKADADILNDSSPNYRVLNIASNVFNNATTSYHHKSIGGYHAAKLIRYQELIENVLQPQIEKVSSVLKSSPQPQVMSQTLQDQTILNMLNTKYITYNPSAAPIPNLFAYGNAWFVNNYKIVPNAQTEINELKSINPSQTALIDQRFESQLKNKTFNPDSAASIKLTKYTPNQVTYQSKTLNEQLAVFSEIYYQEPNDGWQAYINGKPAEHFRTNYVLRGLVVPAGENTIDFKFESRAHATGNTVSLICSLLLLAGLGGLAVNTVRKKNTLTTAQ